MNNFFKVHAGGFQEDSERRQLKYLTLDKSDPNLHFPHEYFHCKNQN
jgi:hypothetical protein